MNRRKRSQRTRLHDVSPSQKRLVLYVRGLDHGRMENLLVRSGEPVFDPPPRCVKRDKFGGAEEQYHRGLSQDVLKGKEAELLEKLEAIGDGVVECLQVKDGLPFLMEWEVEMPF